MQRDQVLVALVAVLALLSFGLAANGIDDASQPAQSRPDIQDGAGGDLDMTVPDEVPEDDTSNAKPLVEQFSPRLAPSILVVLGVLALLAVGILWLEGSDGDDRDLPPMETTDRPGADDSIGVDTGVGFQPDEPDATNDVYRAWRTLVDTVDADTPETTTPREYARLAVQRGLDADAVDTLTDAFCEVRYGDEPPGDALERRARSAADAIREAGGYDSSGEGDA